MRIGFNLVALLPGSSFGKFGEGYLRLSYANSIENIHKGLERIAEFIKTYTVKQRAE